MDIVTVLEATQLLEVLKSAGTEIEDATSTHLGCSYQVLYKNAVKQGNAVVARNHEAFHIMRFPNKKSWLLTSEERNKPMGLLMTTHPELGDMGDVNVEEIAKFCASQSKFGVGGETVLDLSVRRSHEHVFSQDEIEHVNPLITGAADLVAAKLLQVSAEEKKPYHLEMDKMVVYQVGDHFDEHRDTVRSVNHVGTAVVTLDTDFEGGKLNFPDENIPYNYSIPAAVAFFTDVRHCVEPVTKGTRVSITFRIVLDEDDYDVKLLLTDVIDDDYFEGDEKEDGEYGNDNVVDLVCDRPTIEHLPGTANYWDDIDAPVRKRLCRATSKPFAESLFVKRLREKLDQGKVCVFGCSHNLPAAALTTVDPLKNLRGIDKAFANSILELGEFKIELVALRVDYVRQHDDCIGDRKVFLLSGSESDAQPMCYFRPYEQEAVFLKANGGAERTGNESAPAEYTYVSVGMSVSRIQEKISN